MAALNKTGMYKTAGLYPGRCGQEMDLDPIWGHVIHVTLALGLSVERTYRERRSHSLTVVEVVDFDDARIY